MKGWIAFPMITRDKLGVPLLCGVDTNDRQCGVRTDWPVLTAVD
jgi:hypothetical protein